MTNIDQPANKQFESSFPEDTLDSKNLVEVIARALQDRKGKEITIMDVSKLTTLTDYFVVCHGTSDVQIKALSDSVEKSVREEMDEKAWKKEGLQGRAWVILDYVNIVVHIMSKEKREFYGLERMWNDAEITLINDDDDAES